MAKSGERPDIEQKIECIGSRIVRGKLAKNNPQVKLYRVNKNLTVWASALGSAGVGHPILTVLSDKGEVPTLTAVLGHFQGVSMWISIAAAVLYVVVLLGRRFYQSGEVEKKATQSLAAFDVFDLLEARLAGALEHKEPLGQLTPLHETSMALEEHYRSVMANAKTCKRGVEEFKNDLINEKSKFWGSRMPKVDRRKR
jgi:hypothetical protein